MSTHYESFTITDFATDDFFIRHHLFPSETSTQFWHNWLLTHPDKKQIWYQAKNLIEAVQLGLSDYTRTFLSEEAEAQLLERILESNAVVPSDEEPDLPLWKQWQWQIAAACIIAVSGLAFWMLNQQTSAKSSYQQRLEILSGEFREKVNSGQVPETFYLPDSSKIVLFPASRLSYITNYDKENRTVYLSGKAIFDVVKNPRKPFFVYANETITKVLGTQFEVSAFEGDKDVIVSVKSGQVSVYQNTGTNETFTANATQSGVLLLPNQQVIYKRQAEQFNKTLTSKPAIIVPPSQLPHFVYDEAYVVNVFADIEKAYGVEIVYNTEVLEKCQLTATLTDESLQDKLAIICKSINATYDIIDAQIVISSKGCIAE